MSKKAQVDFTYNGTVHTIDCTMDEKMKDICQRFAQKVGKEVTVVDFLYLEKALNGDLTFEECLNLQKEPEKKETGAYGRLIGKVAQGLGPS